MPSKAAFVLGSLVTFGLPVYSQIQVLSLTSSANFQPSIMKPGGLASIFCSGLQNIPSVLQAQGYPLPLSLAGVSVKFSGLSAPILAVANLAGGAYQQINIQVPWELSATSGQFVDVYQNGASARFTPVGSIGWSVFFVDLAGYAIAQHASDYRPVTPADPAKAGEWIVVYATNFGPVQNQPADGNPADANHLEPILPDPSGYLSYYGLAAGPDATYQSTHVQSNYIGMLPGSLLYQVNVLIPASQPAGTMALQFLDVYDCGFFFTPGCGRGLTAAAESLPALVPVSN